MLSDDELARFSFTQEWFNRVSEVGAPLYNAGNTNLRPFEQHGGKLIMWHGLTDDSVPPAMSVAFYQGVQKQLGDKVTDSFLRLFLIPGVGHCGGGQGFPQVDVLGPLMAWTEMKKAPAMIVAGRTANQQMGRGGPNMAGGRGPGPDGRGAAGPEVAARVPVLPARADNAVLAPRVAGRQAGRTRSPLNPRLPRARSTRTRMLPNTRARAIQRTVQTMSPSRYPRHCLWRSGPKRRS